MEEEETKIVLNDSERNGGCWVTQWQKMQRTVAQCWDLLFVQAESTHLEDSTGLQKQQSLVT